MKKLIAAVLILMLWAGTAMAAMEIPMTVNALPVQPPFVPKPAKLTMTHEDGYVIIKTNWFNEIDNLDSPNVSYGVDYAWGNRNLFRYDASRQAYVSNATMTEDEVAYLWIRFYVDYADLERECICYVRNEDGVITVDPIAQGYGMTPLWNFDHEGRLESFAYQPSDNEEYCVFFDQFGKAEAYWYEIQSPYVRASYRVDGTMESVNFFVGSTEYWYYESDEWWVCDEDGIMTPCEPPAGYSAAKLYELYPPLVGRVPDNIPGDTDGDGLVVLDDAVTLIEQLGDKSANISDAADVNKDGSVDLTDVLTLLQHFSGWLVNLK